MGILKKEDKPIESDEEIPSDNEDDNSNKDNNEEKIENDENSLKLPRKRKQSVVSNHLLLLKWLKPLVTSNFQHENVEKIG